MSGVASYILSVTAAAIVTAILLSLAGHGSMAGPVKLLAGVFMTLTVVSPVLKLELPDPAAWLSDYTASAQAAAAMGEELADDAAHSFIKSRTEAYILDKAALYGAALEADVTLDDEGIPVCVTLTGSVSPYARTGLAKIIQEDLGIGEEAQLWRGYE